MADRSRWVHPEFCDPESGSPAHTGTGQSPVTMETQTGKQSDYLWFEHSIVYIVEPLLRGHPDGRPPPLERPLDNVNLIINVLIFTPDKYRPPLLKGPFSDVKGMVSQEGSHCIACWLVLYVFMHVYVSCIYLSIYHSHYLYLSIYLYLFIYLSINPSICLSLYLSFYLYLSIYKYIIYHLSICLIIYMLQKSKKSQNSNVVI